jgi:hypothetical protein
MSPWRAHGLVVLQRDGAEVARWPVVLAGAPDLADVDRLARLQLGARRLGCSISVRDCSPELAELLTLAGLSDRLLAGVEAGGEAEGGELVGVEEEPEPGDTVA